MSDITNAVQEYARIQSGGAVTEPKSGSWLAALCIHFGVNEPVNTSWLQALCEYYGITEPLYSSWTIALANYHGITEPVNGYWWWALSEASAPTPGDLIWNTTTTEWQNETTLWNA